MKLTRTSGFAGGIVIVAAAFFMSQHWNTPEPKNIPDVDSSSVNDAPRADSMSASADIDTFATLWKWQNNNDEQTSNLALEVGETKSDTPQNTSAISEASVYEALQAVRVGEQGDLILDHEALVALNDVFQSQELKLSENDLAVVNEYIKNGLPGTLGEQTAQLVDDYYQLMQAEKEFNAIYEPTMSAENAAERYEELSALRQLYMGHEAASGLFSTSDANAQYMFSAMTKELESDQTMEATGESGAAETALKGAAPESDPATGLVDTQSLQAQHQEQTLSIDNWQYRHEQYLQQKAVVVSAAISEEEKKLQLKELLEQHFDASERSKIRHLDLDTF